MKAQNIVKLAIQSRPENIALARVSVAAFIAQLDLTIDQLEDIKVAVSEAVSNSIIHGYESKLEEWVEITVSSFTDFFRIEIKDYGIGIKDVELAMEPTYSTDPDRMGLGFVFMQSFMDEVQVQSEVGKGTTVILTKRLMMTAGVPN